jgi:hypothetical protein
MKKYLLAGASIAAIALGTGAAHAQSAPGKFEMKLGGDAFFEAGFVGHDQEVANRTLEFVNRFRLNIIPTAKADNGLTYGARVRIRANSGAATVDGDRAFVFAQGNFGMIRAGVVNGPSDDTYVAYPMDWQVLGNYDEWKRHLATGTGTTAFGNQANFAWGQFGAQGTQGVQLLGSSGVATKLAYYTPRWSGFQAAVSYEPRSDSVNSDVNRNEFGCNAGQQATCFQDVYEITFNYANEFNGVGVKVGGGYTGGTASADAAGNANDYNDLSSFQFGAQVSYAGFALGGGYVWAGDSGYTKARYMTAAPTAVAASAGKSDVAGTLVQVTDMDSWNVGAQYTTGPLVVGISYLRQVDAGNVTVAGDRTLGAISLGATYTIAPGLQTAIEYTHFDAESDLVNTATTNYDDSGNVVLLRTIVTF